MPLMRTPQRAGAGEGPGGHRVAHALPTSNIVQKGTRGGNIGGQSWASPFPPRHFGFLITSLWDQKI